MTTIFRFGERLRPAAQAHEDRYVHSMRAASLAGGLQHTQRKLTELRSHVIQLERELGLEPDEPADVLLLARRQDPTYRNLRVALGRRDRSDTFATLELRNQMHRYEEKLRKGSLAVRVGKLAKLRAEVDRLETLEFETQERLDAWSPPAEDSDADAWLELEAADRAELRAFEREEAAGKARRFAAWRERPGSPDRRSGDAAA